jgi:ABC-type transporter Mla subunit MlaD
MTRARTTIARKRRERVLGVLRRRPAVIGVVVTGTLGAVVYLALISTNGIPILSSYQLRVVLPRDAPTFAAGGPVRVAGQDEGVVSSVVATDHGQLLTFRLASAAAPVGRDVRLTMRPESAAGGEYLDVNRGHYAQSPLRSGSLVPTGRIGRTEDLLGVVQGFDHAALAELSSSTRFLGVGVAGEGAALNESFYDLGGTLATTAGVLHAMTPGNDLAALTADANQTALGRAGRAPDDFGRLNHSGANFFATLGGARGAIAATLRRLRPAEDQALTTLPVADPLLAQATVLANRLTPALAAFRSALPPVNSLLEKGDVLRAEVPPIVSAARPPLHVLSHVLAVLPAVAAMLGASATPLGPLAAYMAQYGPELDAGFATFDVGYDYHAPFGVASGAPAVGAELIFTCATGVDESPPPGGRVWNDRTKTRCR